MLRTNNCDSENLKSAKASKISVSSNIFGSQILNLNETKYFFLLMVGLPTHSWYSEYLPP